MESIIVFVVIAILSSLFDKNKQQKRRTKTPTASQERETTNHRNPTGQGRLGDLIKDFSDVFKERDITQHKQPSYDYEYTEYEGYEVNKPQQQYQDNQEMKQEYDHQVKDKIKPVAKNIISEDEITDDNLDYDISFDEETLLKGIIMSEILDKPKALRR